MNSTRRKERDEIQHLAQDFQKIKDRTDGAEMRISKLEDTLTPLVEEVTNTQVDLKSQENRLMLLEDRHHRNNVRLLGFLGKIGGGDTVKYIESWLIEQLGKESFSSFFRN